MLLPCALTVLLTPGLTMLSELPRILEWRVSQVPVDDLEWIEASTSALLNSGLVATSDQGADLYLRRGCARYYLRKPALAAEDLRRTLELRSGDADARSYLASLLVVSADTRDEALRHGEALIADRPELPHGYDIAATYHFALGNFEKAIEGYTLALSKDERCEPALRMRAAAHYNRKDYHACLADLRTAMAAPPSPTSDPSRLHRMYGRALVHLGELEEAERWLSAAVKLGPDVEATYEYLWTCLARQKRFASCRTVADEYAQRFPNEALANALYAVSLAQGGQLSKAVEYAERAVRIDPQSARGWSAVGRIRAMTGEYDAAITAYGKSLRRQAVFDTSLRLAFLAATCPDERFRDGHFARRLLSGVLDQVAGTQHVGTANAVVALVEAECGNYDAAVEAMQKALDSGQLDERSEEGCRKLIKQFRSGRPYRHDPAANGNSLFEIAPAELIVDWRVTR